MNFMTTGSIYSYTQTLKLSQTWNIKKNNGNYLQKDSSIHANNTEDNAAISEFDQYREQLEQLQQQNNPDLLTLYSKLHGGKKLSAEELNYLRDHDPSSYQQAKEMEAERESYKRELKQCRTKEDVERLRTNRIAARFAVANSISHNSNIPKLTKMQLMAAECAKIQAIDEETRTFKTSLAYTHMPTDAEQKEAYKEKMDELRGDTEHKTPKKSEEASENDSVQIKSKSEAYSQPEQPQDAQNPKASSEKAPVLAPQASKISDTLIHSEKTFDSNYRKTDASAIPYHTAYGREIYKTQNKKLKR